MDGEHSVSKIKPGRGRPPAKERLHGAIARRLGVAIVSGEHAPGEVLENEVDAAERLQVSRSAYREAVMMLSAKGLVESRPKTGTQVSPRQRWNLLDPDVLSWFFQAEAPDPAFIGDLFELRMIIEPAAAALAAERRSTVDLSRMRIALTDMEREGLGTEAGRLADRDFHDAVLEAAGNAPLLTLASGIGAAVRWTTMFKQQHSPEVRDPMPEHWRVFDCIAGGDAEQARAAMAGLVRQAREDTKAVQKG
jgi:DNA-binding FadR family transcriptional regulator